MLAFEGGVEFVIGGSTIAGAQKKANGFTDNNACGVIRVAFWYAQQAGDVRHNATRTPDERSALKAWELTNQAVGRRALAGVAVSTSPCAGLPLEIKIQKMQEQKGIVLAHGNELTHIIHMVDMLEDRRVEIAATPLTPEYTRYMQEARPLLHGALIDLQPVRSLRAA